jgi:hypothetical protein
MQRATNPLELWVALRDARRSHRSPPPRDHSGAVSPANELEVDRWHNVVRSFR